jgi:hypothetical protein
MIWCQISFISSQTKVKSIAVFRPCKKIKRGKKPNNYLRYFFLIQQQSVAVWRGALARCWAVMAAAGLYAAVPAAQNGPFCAGASVLVNSRCWAVLAAAGLY